MGPYSQVNQAAMKAPLSCSVPLACDLLALSKSCNAINDEARGGEAGKKKENQRDINRAALIGPSSWVTGYMGESRMILCGSVCRRINPSDHYRVRWALLSICDHW